MAAKKPAEEKMKAVTVRMRPGEIALIKRAAKKHKVSFSHFVVNWAHEKAGEIVYK